MENSRFKFRAWDSVYNEMLKDYPEGRVLEIMLNQAMGRYKNTRFENNPFEFMQYTGLKDKNGFEIYEGDIVKVEYVTVTLIGEIKYGTAMFYIYCNKKDEEIYLDEFKTIEVIGNIYENKELLEG